MGCGNTYNAGRPSVPSCNNTGWGCNYPVGMSPLELINYDKDLYALYRTHNNMEDGFPWDPIVSTGFLAAEYQLSDGLAWVNLLTPDSQDNISLADNMIVPVQTYTNDRAMPPYEKKMIGPGGQQYEANYSGAQLDMQAAMVVANKGNLPPFRPNNRAIPFVGDLSSYFEEESRILSKSLDPNQEPAPSMNPVSAPVSEPVGPTTTPSSGSAVNPTGPVASPTPTQTPTYTPTEQLGTGTSTNPTAPVTSPTAPQTVIVYPAGFSPGGIVQTPTYVEPLNVGGGSVGGGGSSEEAGSEAEGEQGAEGAAVACKINWMPVIIGLVIGTALGYYYADKKKKSKTTFTTGGAVLFGLIGYLIARQKCYPSSLISKLKASVSPAPAPAPAKAESTFCAGCGMV